MPPPTTIETIVAELAALPAHDDPLAPFTTALTAALGNNQTLTLQTVRAHNDLLFEATAALEEQAAHIQTIIRACQQLQPIPLTAVPHGF